MIDSITRNLQVSHRAAKWIIAAAIIWGLAWSAVIVSRIG